MTMSVELDTKLDEILEQNSQEALSKWLHENSVEETSLFNKFYSPEKKIKNAKDKFLETSDEALSGNTPMHYAIEKHEKTPWLLDEMLKYISKSAGVRKGMDAEATYDWEIVNEEGMTLTSAALYYDDPIAWEKLLKGGAMIQDNYIMKMNEEQGLIASSAMGVSIARGATRMFELLLSIENQPATWDICGKRPVHIAAEFGDLVALTRLLIADDMQERHTKAAFEELYCVRENFYFPAIDGKENVNREFENEDRTSVDAETAVYSDESTPSRGTNRPSRFHDGEQNVENFSSDDSGLLTSWRVRPETEEIIESQSSSDDSDENFVDLADLLNLEEELEGAGVEVGQDASGNITLTFGGNGLDRDKLIHSGGYDTGSNLLHLACKSNEIDVIRLLLSKKEHLESINDSRNDGMTPLHLAAVSDSPEAVELILGTGKSDVDTLNDILGVSPLHLACGSGSRDVVNYLVEKGAEVNRKDENGYSPLHYAASNPKAMTCAHILIENGARLDEKSDDGETPLYIAASRWNMPIFWDLMERGADASIPHADESVILGFLAANSLSELGKYAAYISSDRYMGQRVDVDTIIGDNGQTALHMAANEASVEAVNGLLQASASTGIQDENGMTPMQILVQDTKLPRQQRRDCILALIRAGAIVDQRDKNGFLPIHRFTEAGDHVLLANVIAATRNVDARVDSQTSLHIASSAKDVKAIRVLVEAGANMESENADRCTPLMICTKLNFLEGSAYLLEKGSNVNACDSNGRSSLHLCSESKHPAVGHTIGLLVERSGDVDAVDTNGETPLHIHIKNKRLEGVRALLACGANADILSSSGQTPLMVASEKGQVGIIRSLLGAGANVDKANSHGHTALYYFCDRQQSSLKVLRLLLQAGSLLNRRDEEGDTVLHEAVLRNQLEIVRYLVRKGIHINSQNNNGETPLFQATQRGFTEIARFLTTTQSPSSSADPRIPDLGGTSPFQLSRQGGNPEMISIMLQALNVKLSAFAPVARVSQTPGEVDRSSKSMELDGGVVICPICQNEFAEGDTYRKLPCEHSFHDGCIGPWVGGETMESNRTCPVCKQPVAPIEF